MPLRDRLLKYLRAKNEWTPCFEDKAIDINKSKGNVSNSGIYEAELRAKMLIYLLENKLV